MTIYNETDRGERKLLIPQGVAQAGLAGVIPVLTALSKASSREKMSYGLRKRDGAQPVSRNDNGCCLSCGCGITHGGKGELLPFPTKFEMTPKLLGRRK